MNRTLLFLTLFGAACSDPPKSVKGAENGQQSDLGDRDSDGGSEEDGGDSVTCEAFAFTVDGAPCEESCAELVCPCGDHRSTFSSCTPDGCIVDLRCSALCEAGETRAAECDVVYNHAESEPLDYVVYCAEQVAIPAEQCMALAGIDRVFEVANWFDVDSPCGFEGVTCDGEGGVISVTIEPSLGGELPDVFAALSTLTSIVLMDEIAGEGKISGTLPPSFFTLTNLESLNMVRTVIAIDYDQLSALTSLSYLSVTNSRLPGTFPQTIGALINLQFLRLLNNGLTGTLPDGIGSLTNLETFNVGFNALTGTVPPALFDIATLDDIAIDHNMLEGALPAALVTLNPSDFKASHNGCFVAEDPQTEAWLTAADPEWACGCTMTCL